MRVAITGASGFVASHLKEVFADFVEIKREDSIEEIVAKLKGVYVVFNLAGAPIVKRWSRAYKKVLHSSRIDTTKKLVSAINQSDVQHFISASAIGAYPDNGSFDESYTEYGDDFLGKLTKEWEAAARECTKPTAIVRFGVILGSDGGALAQMLLPFKMGVGGTIGNGKMVTSWIDVDDLVGMLTLIIEKRLTGVFNATAPNPVTNRLFTKVLGNLLHRFTLCSIPKYAFKFIFGEGATVLTGSKEVYPTAILSAGYRFKYATIEESLKHLVGK